MASFHLKPAVIVILSGSTRPGTLGVDMRQNTTSLAALFDDQAWDIRISPVSTNISSGPVKVFAIGKSPCSATGYNIRIIVLELHFRISALTASSGSKSGRARWILSKQATLVKLSLIMWVDLRHKRWSWAGGCYVLLRQYVVDHDPAKMQSYKMTQSIWSPLYAVLSITALGVAKFMVVRVSAVYRSRVI